MTTHEERTHLFEVLKDFDSAILTTHSLEGGFHGRPMGLAEVQQGDTVYFCASLDSPKIREIESDPTAMISVQGKTRWATLRGRARVVRDRAKIHELWRESWKLWFPNGKDDPDLCLIALDPIDGEYWDNRGMRGVRFAFEAAKAFVKGRTPNTSGLDENAKVRV
jgi:general stress protein 26